MIHDYVKSGFQEPPLQFASNYYLHYPSMAIGFWPPLFYGLAAVWMLLCGIGRDSVLILIAIISAILAIVIAKRVRDDFGFPAGVAAGLMFCLFPVVRWHNNLVLTDGLVALFGFNALLRWGEYLERPTIRNAIVFSLLTALGLMTKISAAFVFPAAGVALLLSGRISLLRKRNTWLAFLVIGVICAPWYFAFGGLSREGFVPDREPSSVVAWNVTKSAYEVAGPIVLIAGIVGVISLLRGLRPVPGRWGVLIGQVLAVSAMLVVAPVYLEPRYFISAVPAVLVLAFLGFGVVSQRLWRRIPLPAVRPAAFAVLAALAVVAAPPIPLRPVQDGLQEAAEAALAAARNHDSILLVASDRSETSMVSEIAPREDRRPGHIALRASKVLEETDWNRTISRLRYESAQDIASFLSDVGVDLVLVELSTDSESARLSLLIDALEGDYAEWELVSQHTGEAPRGSVYRIYRQRLGPQQSGQVYPEILVNDLVKKTKKIRGLSQRQAMPPVRKEK